MATQDGRRAFLLGITLNELSFIMFFLLMIVSASSLQSAKQQLVKEIQLNQKLQTKLDEQSHDDENFKRLQLLENRLMGAMGFSTKPSSQQLDELFKRLVEANNQADLQQANQQLQGQLKSLQEYKQLVDSLAGNDVADVSPQGLQKLLLKAELALQEQKNLQGRLAFIQKKLQANGLDHPPCWADVQTGAVEYLYRMTLFENNIKIVAAWPEHRKADFYLLPDAKKLLGKTVTIKQLAELVKPLVSWSKRHDCRHFVRIKDDPNISKEAFKRQMLAIEAYFYKYLER